MLVRTHKIIAVELTPNHGVRYPLTKPTPKSVYTDYNRTSTAVHDYEKSYDLF